MSTAQPASVSTDGSPVDNSTEAAAGVDVLNGGHGGQSDVEVEDVVEEEEHTFNEELNLNRIGASRSHMDDGYSLNDDGVEGGDMPGPGSAGRWNQHTDFGGVSVNGAKTRQWKLCIDELNDVREQCKVVFGTQHPTRQHIVKYFYGETSRIWYVFRDRLGWDHKKFLLFMATNCTISICRCSSRELYSGYPFDTSGIMSKGEYTACWNEICNVGMQPMYTGANAEELFWEQVEDALNKMLHQLVIVGRNGKQIYLIDDDKFHYESHSRNHRHWNIKFIKHVNDNRWGGVIDTLCIPALLMPCNVYTHRRGTTQIDASIKQLFGSAFCLRI